MIKLSKRLQGVANLVTEGSYIADVGTDHAYVPIFLCQKNIITGAIAMDVSEGPLGVAGGNIRNYGLEKQIELRLSDGFAALTPGEVEVAILAGMGGAIMIKILSSHMNVTTSLQACVLQPLSGLYKIREFLISNGFMIVKEDLVKEKDNFYPMVKVIPPKKEGNKNDTTDGISKDSIDSKVNDSKEEWSKVELAYGKLLLEGKHPILKEFLERELIAKTAILEHVETKARVESKKRIEALQDEIDLVRKGISYYAV